MPAPATCSIDGTVYGPGGTPSPNTVVVFDVPQQIINGAVIDSAIVSSTTDSNGDLAPLSLPQGATILLTIAGGMPVVGIIPRVPSANLNQVLAGTVFSGGSFQANGVNLQSQATITHNTGFGITVSNPSGGIVRYDLGVEGFKVHNIDVHAVPLDFIDGLGILVSNSAQGVIKYELDLAGFAAGVGMAVTSPAPGRIQYAMLAADRFASGTRMLFDQDAAPTGWTRDVNAANNDRMIRIMTSGARVPNGGAWAISGLTSPAHLHGLGGHVHFADHIHDLNNHTHTIDHVHRESAGINQHQTEFHAGSFTVTENDQTDVPSNANSGVPSINGTGASSLVNGLTNGPSAPATSDTTAVTIASDGLWRPLHRDCIVAQKD